MIHTTTFFLLFIIFKANTIFLFHFTNMLCFVVIVFCFSFFFIIPYLLLYIFVCKEFTVSVLY